MTYEHPMRRVVFNAYRRMDGKEYIARADPERLCPMFFRGATEEEALSRAEAFRAETVAKHEEAYIRRQEAMAVARSRKKKVAVK